MRDEKTQWLNERATYNIALRQSPYDARLYLQRARCYENLEYPHLAANDAYRALLLTDEVLDNLGEWHKQAVEAIQKAPGNGDEPFANDCETSGVNGRKILGEDQDQGGEDDRKNEEPWYIPMVHRYARQSYETLARTLFESGDLKSAYDFTERGLKCFVGIKSLQDLQDHICVKYKQSQLHNDPKWDPAGFNPKTDLPEIGSARREIYPWNDHEIDRFSEESMSFLNSEIEKVAPQCQVRTVELPMLGPQGTKQTRTLSTITQLGVFATSDISPHQTVLLEPSVLTLSTRLHDSLCDACSSPLPPFSLASPLPTCPSCDDIFFCSSYCLDRAQ